MSRSCSIRVRSASGTAARSNCQPLHTLTPQLQSAILDEDWEKREGVDTGPFCRVSHVAVLLLRRATHDKSVTPTTLSPQPRAPPGAGAGGQGGGHPPGGSPGGESGEEKSAPAPASTGKKRKGKQKRAPKNKRKKEEKKTEEAVEEEARLDDADEEAV